MASEIIHLWWYIRVYACTLSIVLYRARTVLSRLHLDSGSGKILRKFQPNRSKEVAKDRVIIRLKLCIQFFTLSVAFDQSKRIVFALLHNLEFFCVC